MGDYHIYREIVGLRNMGGWAVFRGDDDLLARGVPQASNTGAWVIMLDHPMLGNNTVLIRECPADMEFSVPCCKIIGTITLEWDGRVTYDGQYIPFYYTEL